MPRGRPPKPAAQRRREGNAGKRKIPKDLPAAAPLDLTPPDDLLPEGVRFWHELVTALTGWNQLHRVDRVALTAVCVQWQRAEQARQVLRHEGMFSRGSTGQLQEHPALGIERAAHAQVIRFLSEYGGTPVARARIAAAGQGAANTTPGLPFPAIGPSPRLTLVSQAK
jgi:P27 family predicted phage terminase small subunit